MWTIISFIVLIAIITVLAYFLFCFSEKIDDLKLEIEVLEQTSESKQADIYRLKDKVNMELYEIGTLERKILRWQDIAKTFHSRIKNYSVGVTRFKTPETDIRVLQVYARDELAIELQKDGLITYKMSEHYREDLHETEVKVTASINVNKIKP